MELADVCQTDKASDLIADLKGYFAVQSDRDLIEIALTLTGIVVDNAGNGEIVIEDTTNGERTTLELKKQESNVARFPNTRRTSLEVISAHSKDDCA